MSLDFGLGSAILVRRRKECQRMSRHTPIRPTARLLRYAFALAMLVATIPAVPPVKATFPGGNGRIFYSREMTPGDDLTAEIFSIKPNGEGIKRLTNNEDVNDEHPAVTSDGKWVFFQRGFGHDADIWRMRRDGSRKRNITQTSGVGELRPAPSPNGERIAFARSNESGIFVMRTDGNGVTVPITDPDAIPAADDDPDWSASGNQIVFSRLIVHGGGIVSRVCTVRSDGTDEECVTDPDEISALDPEWSPDSRKVVFSGNELDDPDEEWEIYAMDAFNLVRLTTTVLNFHPAYSPDGKKIVFFKGFSPAPLYIMNDNGFGARRLTPAGKDAQDPDWSVTP
jgi:Tol biopolymer transport system component